jgi:hypothetical protein
MGVNLVTRVRSFAISTQTFTANDHDVQDGCVTPGTHRIMRFDFLSYNAGNSDLVIGSPASRPDLVGWTRALSPARLQRIPAFQYARRPRHHRLQTGVLRHRYRTYRPECEYIRALPQL